MKTVTVWLLHLNKPEHWVCGPYLSEEAAIAAGGGRVEPPHLGVAPDCIQVHAGLVTKMEEVPTMTLAGSLGTRHVFDAVGERLTDSQLDQRFPYLEYIQERLVGKKLVGP